jgi:LPS export ABC transporter protein LptC
MIRLPSLSSILLFAMAGLLLVTVYFLLASGVPTPEGNNGGPQEAPAVVSNFTFTETRGGETRWHLRAERALYFEEQNRVDVEGIVVDLRQGDVSVLHLEAARGTVDLAAFSFDLTGEIVLTDPGGLDLRTAAVHFDGQTRHLSGNEPLQLHRPPYRVVGQRFSYEVTTQRLVVDGAVSVTVAGTAT